jgi:hypothetical protein
MAGAAMPQIWEIESDSEDESMHISPNRHPLLSWSSHPERPPQEVVALAMTHPAQIRVQARCRHVADWLRRGCRVPGGRGASDQGPWVMTNGIMDSRK